MSNGTQSSSLIILNGSNNTSTVTTAGTNDLQRPLKASVGSDGGSGAVRDGTVPIRKLAEAIAKAEGWPNGKIGSANNNPCNTRASGDLGKSKGFGKFSTTELGFQSCEKTLRFYISRGRTLQEMIRYFSPESDGNNPEQHATNIAKFAGIAKNIPLKNLIY